MSDCSTVKPLSKEGTARLGTVDCLRGIAVSSVCLHHFTNGNDAFLSAGPWKSGASLGVHGVQIFFVISGFILPYAMQRSGYQAGDFLKFIQKRLIRLEPPYLIAILASLTIGSLVGLITGNQDGFANVSLTQFISHLGYATEISGHEWINPVYWTLAIEFQFYLLVSLLFPLVMTLPRWISVAVLVALAHSGFILTSTSFVFRHWCLFLMGMTAFFKQEKIMGAGQIVVLLGVCIICGIPLLGWTGMIAGITTAAAIAFWKTENRILRFLGSISFSLYLLHGPIGMRVINFSMRMERSAAMNVLVIITAALASIGAAYFFWLWVERPAQNWAGRIRYSSRSKLEVSAK